MIEAWGHWTLETSVVAGGIGGLVLASVALLRPGPDRKATLLAIAMAQFLVPPLLQLPITALPLPPFPELEGFVPRGGGLGGLGGGGLGGDLGPGAPSLVATLALAQWVGLLVGGLLLLRSALRLRRILEDAETVEGGTAWESVRRLARRMETGTPRLHLAEGRMTAAAGIAPGSILLPRTLVDDLDPAALRMVLAHEMSHLARHDPVVAGIRHMLVALWWFHPVAWMLARAHRGAAEDACDDAALSYGGGRPEAYCEALLACAAGPGDRDPAVPEPPAAFTAFLGRHPLARRFRRLLGASGADARAGPWGAGVVGRVVLAVALLALPARAVSWEDRPGAGDVEIVRERIVIRSTRVAEP